MRVKVNLDMPIQDLILLRKLTRKRKIAIGLFIKICVAEYLEKHYGSEYVDKLMEGPITRKEWYILTHSYKDKR